MKLKFIHSIYTYFKGKTSKTSKTFECPICFEHINKNNKYTTYCGHTFCLECTQILNNNNCVCPLCRTYFIQHPVSQVDIEVYTLELDTSDNKIDVHKYNTMNKNALMYNNNLWITI